MKQTAIIVSMADNNNEGCNKRTVPLLHDGEQRMTSLEIAELTGKPHNDVLKSIRKMEPAWERVQGGKFSLLQKIYQLPNGGTKTQPYYQLTKTETLYIATKFNDEARARLVIRWQQLEEERREAMEWERWKQRWAQKDAGQLLLGVTPEEVLDEADDILGEELDKLNRDSDDCFTPTEIGKPWGLEGRDLNSFLADRGIIRWGHGQWELTKQYLHKGLTENRSVYLHSRSGRRKLVSRLVWTRKGREFILDMIR